MSSYWTYKILYLCMSIPGMLLALSLHEAAHGFMAYRLGDPTAKNAGRLTINPFSHLDPIGTLCLLFAHVGWAKPVPVNPNYFKKPRRDIALVSVAGPLMNFLLAFVLIILFKILGTSTIAPVVVLSGMCYYGAVISIGLGVFNLIPIPPLDGSKILMSFLPFDKAVTYAKYEQYIQAGLFVLLLMGVLSTPIGMCINAIYGLFNSIISVVL